MVPRVGAEDGRTERMWALTYDGAVASYVAVKALERLAPTRLRAGRVPGLKLERLARPMLPGPAWLRMRPILTGICGSDLALLAGHTSPALSPFASFPAVLGHEVLARVLEVGGDASDIAVGQRVVVDPFISCTMRGLPACAPCARGESCLCMRSAEGALAPGMLVGYCRDLPGGCSEEMVVHRSQVHAVPEAIPDRAAVLVEPLSVALHAVLKDPPLAGSKVLVLGGGTLGLSVLAALRLLGLTCDVTVLARYPFQAAMAEALGADRVYREGGKGGDAGAGRAAVEVAGARRYRPIVGSPVYAGGFDWVYDCIGSSSSLDQSLRIAGPGGRVMLVGCAGEVSRLDWSFVWARELKVTGTYGYAGEPSLTGAPHTMDVVLRLLQERTEMAVERLVTHCFPLAEWRQAIGATFQRGHSGALKVLLEL